jgi:hypothetical protein
MSRKRITLKSRLACEPVSGDCNCPWTGPCPELCRRVPMKNDPYPLHIAPAVVSLAIVLLVWAVLA